jgi:hypothetical protein
VSGKFLTDWAVFCSTLPGPDTQSDDYDNLALMDGNMLSYELLHPEVEKRRLTTSSIMKVTEEQILPKNFGQILYRVAFIDDEPMDDSMDVDEDRAMSRLAKFLDGLAECSRRGARKALSVIFQCCNQMYDSSSSKRDRALAEDLVNTAYRIALSADFLAASVDGDIVDLDLYSVNDTDCSMSTSLLDFAARSGMDTMEIREKLVTLPIFIDWAETMFPCLALTLETYLHYIFFPDRPYPPSRTHFLLPSLDNPKSSFFSSTNLSTGSSICKSKSLFLFSCMSPMLGGSVSFCTFVISFPLGNTN